MRTTPKFPSLVLYAVVTLAVAWAIAWPLVFKAGFRFSGMDENSSFISLLVVIGAAAQILGIAIGAIFGAGAGAGPNKPTQKGESQ